ncbi:MAG: DUF4492 domain-containing protein [Bacteroidales bacterium]
MRIIRQIYLFYLEGFQSMTVGKRLWIIILIKLFIFFVILRIFFFPDILKTKFNTDGERGNYVLEQLTK